MSGNFTAVRETSGVSVKIREMSGEKSCQENCLKTSFKIVSTGFFCITHFNFLSIILCLSLAYLCFSF